MAPAAAALLPLLAVERRAAMGQMRRRRLRIKTVAHNRRPRTAEVGDLRRFVRAAAPVRGFVAKAGALTAEERAFIVDQAILLFESFYAHLPLKCAMYAVDPLRRLRLLRHRLAQFGTQRSIAADLSFHAEMIDIFTSVRDLHTRYLLPLPFQSASAFLPFDVEAFYERGVRKYLATHFAQGYRPPSRDFRPGVEVLSWNGMAIGRAVELAGRQSAGTNPAARHANGLLRLTKRPLSTLPPPDEDWVIVGYRAGKREKEVRVAWKVLPQLPAESAADPRRPGAKKGEKAAKGISLSVAHEVDQVRQARKLISAPHVIAKSAAIAGARDKAQFLRRTTDTLMVDYFKVDVRRAKRRRGRYGYIRIFKFPSQDPEPFVSEFRRIIEQLSAVNGLVIDIRDNPGGKIVAAEQLLQLLTSRRPIEPQRLYFINTPMTLRLCQLQARGYDLAPWIPSIERSMETGATFSASFPIESRPGYCNEFAPAFTGPVVLVTNALTYSAAEFFAAGFQDHRIGTVLGTDSSTGAAGAHVKDYATLREFFAKAPDTPFKAELPKQAGMTTALRRSARVGVHAGAEVEDFGVRPDVLYRMTRKDLLKANVDLQEYAAGLVGAMRVRHEARTGSVQLEIGLPKIRWSDGKRKRINEVEILVDWVLRRSIRLSTESARISLGPTAVGRPIEIQGYLRPRGATERHLIAVRRI